MKWSNRLASLLSIAAISMACSGEQKTAQTQEVNVYTHRHYEADQALFDQFTSETGIKVNVINASADELIERLATEGAESPADVLITVDAGRLNRAQERGLLQPIQSEVLTQHIAPEFRDPEGHWFGITYRARIIAYAKDRVNPDDIRTYEDLAKPQFKGKILVRSSDNVYNQSLMASMIAAHGEEKALEWARGLVSNFARDPKGSDRDQVKAIAAGEGDLAIVNTYYIGLLLNGESEEERKAGESVGIIFPNQSDRGTHVNVSGVGVAKHAPNQENAIKLIEFLASAQAQSVLAAINYEYPIHPDVQKADLLATWGDFKRDAINLALLGQYNESAIKIFDQAGWK
jgi:iron(III) transport system substrate-binding protein